MRQQNRINALDHGVVQELLRLQHDEVVSGKFEAIRALLPAELSGSEINLLGLRIRNTEELQNPSMSGYSHGKKAETKTILSVGACAALAGDFTTAENAKSHLKGEIKGIDGRVGAFVLGQEIRKKREKRDKAHSLLRVVK